MPLIIRRKRTIGNNAKSPIEPVLHPVDVTFIINMLSSSKLLFFNNYFVKIIISFKCFFTASSCEIFNASRYAL